MGTKKNGDDSAAVQVRIEGPFFAQLEDWRRAQAKIPSRADALRKLVMRGLKAEQHAT